MVRVQGGTFNMGGRSVTVSTFYMDAHLVTQREWTEMMGTTVRQQWDRYVSWGTMRGEGDNHPMYFVSWFEAAEFANRRSLRAGLTPAYTISGTNVTWNRGANGYRLPTEAEWEFAARGGVVCRGNFEFSGSNVVSEVAWYSGNSGGSTQPVGLLRPNALRLYDMSGNVWEWVWDWWGTLPSSGQATNPAGAAAGVSRVVRGGGWGVVPVGARSAFRGGGNPVDRLEDIGFRVVRP